MSNILISYADDAFKYSAIRLKSLAKKTRFFDKIKIYSPRDMPPHIKSSPLFHFKKGGGYWVWKPYIIENALTNAKYGDVVYYIDAGCFINTQANDWESYSNYLTSDYSSIFFEYRKDYDYGWQNYGINSTELRHWIKPETANYFIKYLGSSDFLNSSKICCGFIALKKCDDTTIIDEWLRITLLHPELVIDPFGIDLVNLPPDFNCHRHDQSIVTPLVYKYKDSQNVLLLPETIESQKATSSVVAERYRLSHLTTIEAIKYRLYYMLK